MSTKLWRQRNPKPRCGCAKCKTQRRIALASILGFAALAGAMLDEPKRR